MDYILAEKLVNTLKACCPYRSGALMESIQVVQFANNLFVVQIGNDSGSEANGNTPTKNYASITNQPNLVFKKKNGEVVTKRNKNARWVNRAVDLWIQQNKLNLAVAIDDDEEEEEEG